MKVIALVDKLAFVQPLPDGRGILMSIKSNREGVWVRYMAMVNKSGIELWGDAIRRAAKRQCDIIEWDGFPEVNQAIQEFVDAGGKL